MRGLLTIILLPLFFEANSDGAQFNLGLKPDNSNQQPNDILFFRKIVVGFILELLGPMEELGLRITL